MDDVKKERLIVMRAVMLLKRELNESLEFQRPKVSIKMAAVIVFTYICMFVSL